MAYPHKALGWLTELIFPYQCLICQKYLDKGFVCQKCLKSLPIKKQDECVGCERPTPLGQTCTFCREKNQLDQLFTAGDLKNVDLAALIKAFKYRFLPSLAEPLAEFTARHLNHLAQRDGFSFVKDNPLLVPVPLATRRKNWRGFNQAELLTQAIARHYRLEISDCLLRVKNNTPQAKIDNKAERLSNTHGLFAVKKPELVKGRKIFLIDDVCTTGATLNECARVLKNAGASEVSALVIARG